MKFVVHAAALVALFGVGVCAVDVLATEILWLTPVPPTSLGSEVGKSSILAASRGIMPKETTATMRVPPREHYSRRSPVASC